MSPDAASPLHKVIDARQWDTQGFIGRLMAVVHAAFVHAGFVPSCSKKLDSPPWISGALVATPSLRYTVPRQSVASAAAAAAVWVWLLVRGDHVVLAYSSQAGSESRSKHCRLSVDASAIAPLLRSGDLDDAARALETNAAGFRRLWENVLVDGICEPILDDLLPIHRRRPRRRGATRGSSFPQFMSLPDDLIAAVLSRLTGGGEHLAVVECTCTKLRRLVGDRDGELWRKMYETKVKRVSATELRGRAEMGGSDMYIERANRLAAELRELGDRTSTSSPAASWKAKYVSYVSAARTMIPPSDFWLRFWFSYRLEPTWLAQRSSEERRQVAHRIWWVERQLVHLVSVLRPPPTTTRRQKQNYCRLDARYDPSLRKDPLEPLMRRLLIAKSNAYDRRSNKAAVPCVQSTRRRRCKGAIRSSSSRHR